MCSPYYRPDPTPTEAELVQKVFEDPIIDLKTVLETVQKHGDPDDR